MVEILVQRKASNPKASTTPKKKKPIKIAATVSERITFPIIVTSRPPTVVPSQVPTCIPVQVPTSTPSQVPTSIPSDEPALTLLQNL